MAFCFSLSPSVGRRFFRFGVVAAFLLTPTFLVSSCLTPHFSFDKPTVDTSTNSDQIDGNDETTNTSYGGHSSASGSGSTTEKDGTTGTTGGSSTVAKHCINREIDSDETDHDCGGLDCDACIAGQSCIADRDCEIGSCLDNICQKISCKDGEQNQGESDTDCGGDSCKACDVGQNCNTSDDCKSNSCKDRVCAEPTCEDHRLNQGELDVDCLGPCDKKCDVGQSCVGAGDCLEPEAAEDAAYCVDNKCQLQCRLGTGDCDLQASNGCEANTNSDLKNCGSCGSPCKLPHTSAALCTGGKCEIDFGAGEQGKGCASGYADCNGDALDGCEVELATNPDNCGACDVECSDKNGAAGCEGGQCVIDCEPDFANCDQDATSNGCEVDLLTSTSHCGGCETQFACDQGLPGQAASCDGGTTHPECRYIGCPAGYGACDGGSSCNDQLSTVVHCGACGESCVAANGSSSCADVGSGYHCAISGCTSGFGDCDLNYTNGCETNINSNKTHCGGCNQPGVLNCVKLEETEALHVAQATCNAGGCLITNCDASYADCDLDPSNGCEINLSNNATRCGGCLATDTRQQAGVDCTQVWSNGTGTCNNAGTCAFSGCSGNFEDCNHSLANGCETNLASSLTNCGSCGTVCGGSSSTNVTGTPTCAAKSCNVTCSAGFCANPLDPERKCNVAIGSVSACLACGNQCGGTNPFCDGGNGCKQRFPVEIVTPPLIAHASSGSTATMTFSLTNAPGNSRALVVLVAGANAISSVKYAGLNMLRAFSQKAGAQTGYADIYYLLDAALGSAGNKVITVDSPWGGKIVGAMELKNVAQMAPSSTVGGSTVGNCPSSNSQSAVVTYAGSLVVGALMAQGPSSTGTHTGFGAEFGELFESEATSGTFGYRVNANATLNVGWTDIGLGCYATALAVATFDPLIIAGP